MAAGVHDRASALLTRQHRALEDRWTWGTPYCFYEAEIAGQPADVADLWWFGQPIERGEYEWLRALNAIRPSNR